MYSSTTTPYNELNSLDFPISPSHRIPLQLDNSHNNFQNHNTIKQIQNKNGWSTKKEKILQAWMDECNIYSKVYAYNVMWYERIDTALGIVAILLSAITGASLLNNSGSERDNANVVILIFGSLSMLNTFVQATKEFLNLKTEINSNLIASRQNLMISLDIEAQLNLNRNERKNGKEFLITIKDRKNDLVLNGPIIPDHIWKKIRDRIKGKWKKRRNYFLKSNPEQPNNTINDNPTNNTTNNSTKNIVETKNDNTQTDNESSDNRFYKRRTTLEYINMSEPSISTNIHRMNDNITQLPNPILSPKQSINNDSRTIPNNSIINSQNISKSTANKASALDIINYESPTEANIDVDSIMTRINSSLTLDNSFNDKYNTNISQFNIPNNTDNNITNNTDNNTMNSLNGSNNLSMRFRQKLPAIIEPSINNNTINNNTINNNSYQQEKINDYDIVNLDGSEYNYSSDNEDDDFCDEINKSNRATSELTIKLKNNNVVNELNNELKRFNI